MGTSRRRRRRLPDSGDLPITRLSVNGRDRNVLIDTGSTDNILYNGCCGAYLLRKTTVRTMGGDPFICCGVGSVQVRAPNGAGAQLDVLIVDRPPLGLDMILGYDPLGGVCVLTPSELRFCGAMESAQLNAGGARSATNAAKIRDVSTEDFTAIFDPIGREGGGGRSPRSAPSNAARGPGFQGPLGDGEAASGGH